MAEFPSRSRSHQGAALTGATLVVVLFGGSAIAGVSCVSPEQKHVAVSGQQCVTCHLSEALSATQPPHVGRMAMECGDCHDEELWRPASGFDHDEHFELEGAHIRASCTSCHTTGFESGQTPTTCIGCHERDYQASTFPGHDAFATTCGDCHGQDGWKPAVGGDHDQFFPLEGKHVGVECASCHTNGYSVGATPTACVGCHQDDYDGSPYPGHADFPTTCQDCHTTSGWTPASGGAHPEDAFPITTGKHDEVECLECHDTSLGPMGAGNTDCVQCHSRAKWDPEHEDESGYPTGDAPANFCLDCHEDGSKGD